MLVEAENPSLAHDRQASPRPLAGKAAVVTGSTSGIGLGIARALAAQGANVVLNGLGVGDALDKLRQEIAETHGVEVLLDLADMSKPDEIESLISGTEELLGSVDILINNAGIQHVAPIDEFPTEKWNAIIAIDLSSAFHTTRASLPGMKRRGWGRIINISSAHGLIGSPFKSAYVTAKHGLLGLTKVTALEVAERGITCNAVCPGYVWTPLVEKQIADQAAAHNISQESVVRDILLAQQPNKRFAQIEEMGALVTFLCSEAAGSITGAALPVDGGWTAH